jgi:catechol 2,3-dioxygenase-like lactoylglutathione lyase family enzyme
MIKAIAFTVYAVTDIKKARAFYEGALGLKPGKEFDGSNDSPWVEYDVNGATFAIGCAPGQYNPSEDGAVIAFEVDDFDATIADLKSKKVPFKLEPQDFPTCRMAIITDPDKNRVLIHKKKVKQA